MPLIICIETATTNCSVALAKDGEVLALKEDFSKQYSHAEQLHLFIRDILSENRYTPEDLDAVAVSKGPGSYTGLRIGVSAAKGLCFSLDIPLISVPTLDSMAYQVKGEADFIFPLLDARRMEVYTAGYDSQGNSVLATQAKILDSQSFEKFLDQGICCFLGDGAEKFQSVCTHKNARFLIDRLPSAREIAALATPKFLEMDVEDVAYFEPYYLKDFFLG